MRHTRLGRVSVGCGNLAKSSRLRNKNIRKLSVRGNLCVYALLSANLAVGLKFIDNRSKF